MAEDEQAQPEASALNMLTLVEITFRERWPSG
jgi:hypothetical protein